MAWWIPVLQAIGMNAAKNVVTGQDPLKGAAEAGVTGGILGGVQSQFAGSNTVSGVGSAPSGVSGVGAAPSVASGGSSVIPGSLESEGLLQFNPTTGTYLNPSEYVGESIGMPTYTGGQGLLSNFADDIGSNLNNISPQNLSGVSSLLGGQQDTSSYQQMAGTGGGVKKGAGSNLAVEFPQAKVFKRRKA